MKLFIAIKPSKKINQVINQQITALTDKYPWFELTDPNNYHITLQYIGETDKKKEIIALLKQLVKKYHNFHLFTRGMALMSKTKLTIYVNFYREKIVEQIAGELALQEGNFFPHLTVARTKISSKQQYFALQKRLAQMKIVGQIDVNKIYLLNSRTNQGRLEYEEIESFKLLK